MTTLDAEFINERIEGKAEPDSVRGVVQMILSRQFLYADSRMTRKSYALAKAHWRDIEAIITLLGFRPIRDDRVGIIGIGLRPMADPETGELGSPPREQMIGVQQTCLLLTLRHLYDVRRSAGETDEDAGRAGAVVVTATEIDAAIVAVAPRRRYQTITKLRSDLDDLRRQGLVEDLGDADNGDMLVQILPAIALVLERDQIDLLKKSLPAASPIPAEPTGGEN